MIFIVLQYNSSFFLKQNIFVEFFSSLSPPSAPPGINVFEHESIALDMSNSYSTFSPPNTYSSKSLSMSMRSSAPPPGFPPEAYTPSFNPVVQPRELPRQRLPESFNQVSPLPADFSLRTNSCVSLHRAWMENRNVVLRVLKGETFLTSRTC